MSIDLFFVDGEDLDMEEENFPPFKEIHIDTYEGHVFRAMVSGTDTIVSEFVMTEKQHLYTVVKEDAANNEL